MPARRSLVGTRAESWRTNEIRIADLDRRCGGTGGSDRRDRCAEWFKVRPGVRVSSSAKPRCPYQRKGCCEKTHDTFSLLLDAIIAGASGPVKRCFASSRPVHKRTNHITNGNPVGVVKVAATDPL